jgi:hypothetical protein
VNLLLKLSLSQSILIKIFTSLIQCLSVVVNTFPQAFLEVLHYSLQHGGRNCCHFVPDVLFQVHRCPCFLFIHFALEISSEEEVAGVEIGLSCRPFNIPPSWDHATWEHLVKDSYCSPRSVRHCPVLLKPESMGFNTKSLQLRFQKCAKHLSVAGWIYCYCPAWLVFKEIGADHPKRCYTTPNSNLLRM